MSVRRRKWGDIELVCLSTWKPIISILLQPVLHLHSIDACSGCNYVCLKFALPHFVKQLLCITVKAVKTGGGRISPPPLWWGEIEKTPFSYFSRILPPVRSKNTSSIHFRIWVIIELLKFHCALSPVHCDLMLASSINIIIRNTLYLVYAVQCM